MRVTRKTGSAQGSLEPQGPLAQGQGRLGLALPWRGTRGQNPRDGQWSVGPGGGWDQHKTGDFFM